MKTQATVGLALALGLLVVACGDGGKMPAETAITAAQSAFDAAKAGAAAYVPAQVSDVETSLAAVKATFAKGDYMQALTEAQGMTSKISALTAAAAAKKADLTKSWDDMGASLPSAVSAIQTRLDELSKTRRLPAGLTSDAVAGAKSSLGTITETWNEAKGAFSSGNVMEAVTKAQTVKAKAAEAMTALGMPVPDALK